MIRLSIKTAGEKDVLKLYDPLLVNRAAALAINEAARGVRTEAGKEIRARFNLKAARVNKEIKNVRMAQRTNLTAEVKAQGKPIGLMNFNPKWVRNVGGRARTTTSRKSTVSKRRSKSTGVSVAILRGKRTVLPDAFIGRGRRGSVDGAGALHVFERANSGKSNSYLVNKAAITIASMMQQPRVRKRVDEVAEERWTKRFNHHLDRLLK